MGRTLLPLKADPYVRALVRSQADHISHMLVPTFYHFLQAQDLDTQAASMQEFSSVVEQLTSLLELGEREIVAKGGPGSGLWHEDGELNWTDVMAGPCERRASFLSFFIFDIWFELM